MKNSKLITAGILLLTFLFMHSMQRNIFGATNSPTDHQLERKVNRTLAAFTDGVEDVENLVFTCVLSVVNKASMAIQRLGNITLGPLALNAQINAVNRNIPCMLTPRVPPVPAGPCRQNILIYHNPGLINPRIAGLGIVS